MWIQKCPGELTEMNRLLNRLLPYLAPLLLAGFVQAEDWPQWRGSQRNAMSAEKGLRKEFQNDFRPIWMNTDCGVGYSAPAVVGDRVYLLGATKRDDGGYVEFALALDQHGKQVWKKEITQYAEEIMLPNWGHGPRGTPSIAGGKLFGLGANGDLFAMNAGNGELVWQVNLRSAFGGEIMGGRGEAKNVWGYSESPLVDGEQVICTPGGKKGSVVAVDAAKGNVLWQSTELVDPASYTSVVLTTFGGVRQYVALTAKRLAGLRATDGKVLWQAEVPLNEIAIISTPIISGNQIYITSAYGGGCSLVEVKKDSDQFKAEILYSNKTLANHHGGAVLIDGQIYGWSGNTNSRGRWVCQNLATGEADWTEEHSAPAGCVVAIEGHIYCYTQEDGELICIKATKEGWKETGRFTIPQRTELRSVSGKVWTHPVIANGHLYLRDQDLLFCYDITAGK
jgi:outer membrane protein assembly factor BamB